MLEKLLNKSIVPLLVFTPVIFILWAVAVMNGWILGPGDAFNRWGTFGDAFGPLTSFFTGFALLVAAAAFRYQIKEVKIAQIELEEARKALHSQADAQMVANAISLLTAEFDAINAHLNSQNNIKKLNECIKEFGPTKIEIARNSDGSKGWKVTRSNPDKPSFQEIENLAKLRDLLVNNRTGMDAVREYNRQWHILKFGREYQDRIFLKERNPKG